MSDFYYDLMRSVLPPEYQFTEKQKKKLISGFAFEGLSTGGIRSRECGKLETHLCDYWGDILGIIDEVNILTEEDTDSFRVPVSPGSRLFYVDGTGRRVICSHLPEVGVPWFEVADVARISLDDIFHGDFSGLRIGLSESILRLKARELSRYRNLLIEAGDRVIQRYQFIKRNWTIITADSPATREVGFGIFRCIGMAVITSSEGSTP